MLMRVGDLIVISLVIIKSQLTATVGRENVAKIDQIVVLVLKWWLGPNT